MLYPTRLRSYHVAVAAEAYAAALFAQAGCDVSIQYGANQPGYDLIVSRGKGMRKVSVKGSQDGGWGLIQSFKTKDRTYHEAIDAWVEDHEDPSVLYCLVQFGGVAFGEMPRAYLALCSEMRDYLRASCGGHGYTSLRERYSWSRGKAVGTTDEIPRDWRITESRIAQFVT
jgi:hypothetical protein